MPALSNFAARTSNQNISIMRTKIYVLSASAVIAANAYAESPDSVRSRQLDEIVVRGERPQVKGHAGTMTVDLPSIVKDKPVTNVLEALGYLPGVTDENGMIGLAGAGSVTILLNGELSDMPVGNLYQLLYSTPIDRLKNVEVMYAAPAKYHVSGAVINVVLKTPGPLDGLMGQARAGGSQAHYASFGTGLAATYAVKDWVFDVNWSLSRTRSWNREETFSNHLFQGSRTMIEDDMRRAGSNWANAVFASVSYKALKLTYNGQIISGAKNESLSSGTLGDFNNIYSYPSPTGYHNIALRYAAPFGLTVGADYTGYREARDQHLFSGQSELVKASNRQDIDRYRVYIDQEHRLGNWQLGYGVEYQHSDDRSRQSYSFPAQDGFDDALREDVGNAYVGAGASLDWGLSFNASAKAEYYHSGRNHNWNLVPQLGASFSKTPKSIFQLSFTSQRVYPSYWELHGGTAYINDYAVIVGNPSLQPYMSYAGQLSYIFRQKYVATFYVLYADKYSVQLPYQSADELKLVYQTLNLDYSRTVGLQVNASIDVGNVWNATATANVFNKREKAGRFHDIGFDNGKWIFFGSLANTFRFAEGFPVSLSLDFSFISRSIQGLGTLSPLWKVDAGVKWQFGKKRCCELTLKCDDIFNTWNPDLRINTSGQDFRLKVHDMTRSLMLTFVWKFNGFKPKDTSVDTSRFGTGK